jgi:hypothetical protein
MKYMEVYAICSYMMFIILYNQDNSLRYDNLCIQEKVGWYQLDTYKDKFMIWTTRYAIIVKDLITSHAQSIIYYE